MVLFGSGFLGLEVLEERTSLFSFHSALGNVHRMDRCGMIFFLCLQLGQFFPPSLRLPWSLLFCFRV